MFPPEVGVLVHRNMSGFMQSDCILCFDIVYKLVLTYNAVRTYTVRTMLKSAIISNKSCRTSAGRHYVCVYIYIYIYILYGEMFIRN